MSNQSSPNPIKEYYIAYFDILGYRQFFMDAPEQAENLLANIHNAITNAKSIIGSVNIKYFPIIYSFVLKKEMILELKRQGLSSFLKLYLKSKENL